MVLFRVLTWFTGIPTIFVTIFILSFLFYFLMGFVFSVFVSILLKKKQKQNARLLHWPPAAASLPSCIALFLLLCRDGVPATLIHLPSLDHSPCPCTSAFHFLVIDELYAQKLKYKAISEELDHALNDMTSM